MAFESLTEKLQRVFRDLRGKGKLSEADTKAALKEVRMALLEADVNFKVVKQFVKSIEERAVGAEVLESLTPGQQVVKIVNEELIKLMGSETTEIKMAQDRDITVILMAGLQGAGKTTTAAKLAGKLKAKGHRPLLAACDVYRPAAIEQLRVNGEKVGVPVFSMGSGADPVNIARAAFEKARQEHNDILIVDTAGRLQIDEQMMEELGRIKEALRADWTLLTVDAMTGQEAVNVAKTFEDKVGVDGVIVTKLDGDTRGGAALSIKAVTGKPILFVGMGEKLSDLEQFYPDRMASRILGMGDILSLIEKAQAEVDEAEAGAGRYIIDGWSRFGDDVPAPVVIARYADIASFASNGASRDRARDAWAQVRSLRTQVSKKAGFLARVRRALSLRSLRMRRKLRLSASIARTMDEEKKA